MSDPARGKLSKDKLLVFKDKKGLTGLWLTFNANLNTPGVTCHTLWL